MSVRLPVASVPAIAFASMCSDWRVPSAAFGVAIPACARHPRVACKNRPRTKSTTAPAVRRGRLLCERNPRARKADSRLAPLTPSGRSGMHWGLIRRAPRGRANVELTKTRPFGHIRLLGSNVPRANPARTRWDGPPRSCRPVGGELIVTPQSASRTDRRNAAAMRGNQARHEEKRAGALRGRNAVERTVHAVRVVIIPDCLQLSRQVDRVPEEDAVQVFAPERADQTLNERMRNRRVGDRLDLLDPADAQVGELAAEAKQRVVIGADVFRCVTKMALFGEPWR